MNIYKSQSTIIPKEWDIISSSTTVYHNTNVIELPPKNEGDPIMYEYDVEQYTKAEYESMVVAQTRADVDYIAILQGVEL